MKRIMLFTVLFLFVEYSFAIDFQQNRELDKQFELHEVNGTFVLYDIALNQYTAFNPQRAEQRFVPASTYKIPNSLIGLSVGAVKDADEILPYGGNPQPMKQWEKDMGLRDAIKISNVPVYQELARRIGLAEMQRYVSLLHYGNMDIGSQVDTFWLEGPLKISALEQVQFLAKLAQGELPLSKDNQASVREIVKLEECDDFILYAKTGWILNFNPGIGWWVGWIEVHGKIYCFALNIDVIKKEDLPKRIELGKGCFRALGLIE